MNVFVSPEMAFPHHRRQMESRINQFKYECSQASQNIGKVIKKVESFLYKFDRSSPNYKKYYLHLMAKLDEYNFFIEELNLSLERMCSDNDLDENINNDRFTSCSKVSMQDNETSTEFDYFMRSTAESSVAIFKNGSPRNDINLETSSTSKMESLSRNNSNKFADDLIRLESDSAESQEEIEPVRENRIVSEKELSYMNNKNEVMISSMGVGKSLPEQEVLEVDYEHIAEITYVCDPTNFFLVIDPVQEIDSLHEMMKSYYEQNYKPLPSVKCLPKVDFCACRFNNYWCRALLLEVQENDMLQVYYVDIGLEETVPLKDAQPLPNEFRNVPPFARNCHLSGVSVDNLKPNGVDVMNVYRGKQVNVTIDDNNSESLGVTIKTSDNKILNNLVCRGACVEYNTRDESPEDNKMRTSHVQNVSSFDLDDDDPEYEDPLMAVQGFIPRDEADNCRFYKGPPDTGCFKGSRCKKQHKNIDPMVTGGWTTDQVAVPVWTQQTLELPKVGDSVKVEVTHVAAPNVVFVHIVQERPNVRERPFGTRVARNLAELTSLMNAPSLKPRHPPDVRPALGELLAAPYKDGQLHRAKVTNFDPINFSLQVYYIDYGNHGQVSESDVIEMEPGWEVLPEQAVRCILSGIQPKPDTTMVLKALDKLKELTYNRKLLNAFVVSSNQTLGELLVNIYDDAGNNLAEQLIELNIVDRRPNDMSGIGKDNIMLA